MKATTRKTRWLLIALLFGFLMAAGLTLARHHGAPTVAKANGASAPIHVAVAQPHVPLLASIAAKRTLRTPGDAHPGGGLTAETDSNSHSRVPTNTSTAIATGWSNVATQPPGNRPSTSAAGHPPKNGAGEFAYNVYSPLDCELPAGCGGATGMSTVSHQLTGTSGGMPGAHNSGSTADNINSGTPGQNTNLPHNPPGSPVVAAPELDPATLAGAITLLLGSLALLRSRRVRATR